MPFIEDISEIRYSGCKEAGIMPAGKMEYVGEIAASEGDFVVKVVCESGRSERVWARICLLEKVGPDTEGYAIELGRMAAEDPAFGSVYADLRDGETALMRTWSYDLPGDAELDEWLAWAKDWIDGNYRALQSVAKAHMSPEDGSAEDSGFLADLLADF